MALALSERYWHLPPGRKPGPQSSRRLGLRSSIGRWVLVVILVVCGVGMIGLGAYAAAEYADDVGGGLIAASLGLGVAFLAGVWFVLRGKRPRIAKHFEVSAEPLELRRGAEVVAQLAITDPGSVGERLEVGLVCSEFSDYLQETRNQYGGTTRARQTREVAVHEQWAPASRTEPAQSFRFKIPQEAAFSHEGTCLSYAWRVTAREPTGFRRDPSSHQPIWVEP
jgi:hypothetical protein